MAKETKTPQVSAMPKVTRLVIQDWLVAKQGLEARFSLCPGEDLLTNSPHLDFSMLSHS